MKNALDILGGAIGCHRGRWLRFFREPDFWYRLRIGEALMQRPGVDGAFACRLIDIAEGKVES